MSSPYDYLQDRIRDIEADLRRSLRRAEELEKSINPVSDLGKTVKLEMFSLSQMLGEAVRRCSDTQQQIRDYSANNPQAR